MKDFLQLSVAMKLPLIYTTPWYKFFKKNGMEPLQDEVEVVDISRVLEDVFSQGNLIAQRNLRWIIDKLMLMIMRRLQALVLQSTKTKQKEDVVAIVVEVVDVGAMKAEDIR